MINSPNENILRSERIIYSDSDIPKAAAVCLTLVLFIHVSKLICIGLIGNVVMVIGLLLYHIYAMAYRRKTLLFDPNKNNHTLNLIVFMTLTVILILLFGLLFMIIASS